MMRSDWSIRFSRTRILSLILAPPTMAVSGRCTLSASSTCEIRVRVRVRLGVRVRVAIGLG